MGRGVRLSSTARLHEAFPPKYFIKYCHYEEARRSNLMITTKLIRLPRSYVTHKDSEFMNIASVLSDSPKANYTEGYGII